MSFSRLQGRILYERWKLSTKRIWKRMQVSGFTSALCWSAITNILRLRIQLASEFLLKRDTRQIKYVLIYKYYFGVFMLFFYSCVTSCSIHNALTVLSHFVFCYFTILLKIYILLSFVVVWENTVERVAKTKIILMITRW